jgi:hypothetical protein
MLSLGSNHLLPPALFVPGNKGVTNGSENQLLPTVANPTVKQLKAS